MKLNRKILVVDDDSLTQEFFQIMLGKLGYDVFVASDGLDGLQKVKENKPDLILLDNMMPRLNGFEFTQLLKKEKEYLEYRNTPIIMFSAIDDPGDKVLGLEMGVEDYITKPFNFTEVLARIRNIIKHRELSLQIVKRERRLAILETLNNNLITFVRHVKKPLNNLSDELKYLDAGKPGEVDCFFNKYREYYDEVKGMLDAIEEEILDIETKGNKLKEEELSLDELENKITKHIINMKNNYNSK